MIGTLVHLTFCELSELWDTKGDFLMKTDGGTLVYSFH